MQLSLLNQTLSTLITANHVLHYHNLVDSFGHVSVRNSLNAANNTFFLSAAVPPALVGSPRDFGEYYIDDGSPVSPDVGGVRERFIHSGILKRFPGVVSVVHSHSEDVVPYSVVDGELKAVSHMAGFLGDQVPVFDIGKYYNSTDTQDMLVKNTRLGDIAASYLGPTNSSTKDSSDPEHTVVLMGNHGFATIGSTIEEAVYRAIYTQANARIQTTAINLAALGGATVLGGRDGVKYLTSKERADCGIANSAYVGQAWRLWVREVETLAGTLYQNLLGSPLVS
ncbi:MAG: hypothetical protein M1813_009608 [Trichoglossum hirsutum]|nr:MAG: hypothetical protein M1813_009608 [Trichoglossum hirsutum]